MDGRLPRRRRSNASDRVADAGVKRLKNRILRHGHTKRHWLCLNAIVLTSAPETAYETISRWEQQGIEPHFQAKTCCNTAIGWYVSVDRGPVNRSRTIAWAMHY